MEEQLDHAQMNIRDLVDQVKRGQKNKAEAFAELQSILRKSAAQEGEEDADAEEGDNGDGASNSTGGRISQEDRRMLINKLIEQKRQSKEQGYVSQMGGDAENAYMGGEYENSGYDGAYTLEENYSSHNNNTTRPSSAGPASRNGGSYMDNSYSNSRRSQDDSRLANSRSNRIAQTEAAIRHEMFKDCTFRPQIKALPSHYGQLKEDDSSFYDRVSKWQREKESEASRRKALTEDSEMLDCSFKPKINRNSLRAVQEIRGADETEDPTERLYKNHELSILQRSKFIEDELARERELEARECTFQPNLGKNKNTTKKYNNVRSKLSAQAKVRYEPVDEAKNHSFTPKVKGVGPNMSSAQLYVSTNVVDRLTRPLVTPAEDPAKVTFDGPVMDIASFMGTLNQSGASTATVTKKGSADSKGEGGEKQINNKGIKQFLGRQEQSAIRKQRHLQESSKALYSKSDFQPKLCKKSAEIANKNHKGEFLERVERDVLRRSDHEVRAAVIPDEACTFQPAITAKAEQGRPRTVYEMSRGDLLKRETNYRMMRLRSDQEELQEMTFKPEITRKARNMPAKSSIVNNTEKFLDIAREKQQRKEISRQAELEKRKKDEVDSCTFAPATKDCPAYVRRIAKSMSVIRASRGATTANDDSKPTWK